MKKLIYIALIGALTLGSCTKDFLDRLPQNELPETEFWKTEQDVYLAVNGIYAHLPGASYHDEGATDIAYAQYPWETTSVAVASGKLSSAVNVGWNFVAVRKANYFLENVNKAVMDESLRNRYIAEVRFVRAFLYVNLVNKFGDVPLIPKQLPGNEVNVPRTPKAEVVKFVLDELDAAAEVLPVAYAGGKPNEKGRITKGAALALKARFQLQQNNWEGAVAASKEVMTLGYDLFTVSTESEKDAKDDYTTFVDFDNLADEQKFRLGLRSYEGLFHQVNEGNKEVILDRQYMRQVQSHLANTYLLDASLGGWSSVTPTQNLINAYESYKTGEPIKAPTDSVRGYNYANNKAAYLAEFKNRDPRFYASILFDTAPWNAVAEKGGYKFEWSTGNNMSKTGYNFRKLVDPKAVIEGVDNHANAIVIRYAEVLLTFAESQNELSGPSAEVYDALDKIRERAGMPLVDRSKYSSQESLRRLIRNERVVELSAEGLRYVDIRRWGIAKDVMKTIYDVRNTMAQERLWDDKLMLMPIPLDEVKNSHGVLKQNPGY